MVGIGRRTLLKNGSRTLAAGLAASISRALAIPAYRRSGTLEDVEHIVVLMQENRSFDHYFGHLSGVRGVGDRHPVRSADGTSVWSQHRKKPEDGRIMPFRLQTHVTSAECVLDLDHNWTPTHAAINAGWNDQWPRHKTDMTMGYYQRSDIPYHYALADAFTVCDHYFCSTPTQTHPNRFYLMTGSVDAKGEGGGPVLDNVDWVDRQFYPDKAPPPFTWMTYPERLEAAGIDWQVYQQGLSVTDAENGNFGTNVLMNFANYVNAPEGSALYKRAMSKRTLNDLKADVVSDRLPRISWLLPPAAYSEHPRWTPGYGATYIAKVINALTANPQVWAKTVLFIMYDENDGYFDHVPPPQPPTPVLPGLSTVAVTGEIHDRVTPYEPARFVADQLPYGLGPRVPMLAISPWSTGGFVCSETFDHTSVLRFMEARFGVSEPNITPWRREICGDLTSAFDFTKHNNIRNILPDTSYLKMQVDAECKLTPPSVPSRSLIGDMGQQEPGQRPTRAIGYDLAVNEIEGPNNKLTLRFENNGSIGVCFYVYLQNSTDLPRRYTVGTGSSLNDSWALPEGEQLACFMVLGPNGFVRYFYRSGYSPVMLSFTHNTGSETGLLTMSNRTEHAHTLKLLDNAYGNEPKILCVKPHSKIQKKLSFEQSNDWYDFSVSLEGEMECITRFAGCLNTGKSGLTDPAIGSPVI
jgi:phospholipase C